MYKTNLKFPLGTKRGNLLKYFGTNQGKELMLAGGELSLTAKNQKEGKIQIRLIENEGIEIRSDNELDLIAR
jgi:hypothetical protein